MTKEDLKEFHKLEKEEINRLLDYPEEDFKEKVWKQISLLIENKIEQEGYCGE
jgi:hypothetical protein